MPELVRVRDLDTGHHHTVTRRNAENNDRLQILDDHKPVDKDGRVLAAKPNVPLGTTHKNRTSRTKPKPTPDVMVLNAEDPAKQADSSL